MYSVANATNYVIWLFVLLLMSMHSQLCNQLKYMCVLMCTWPLCSIPCQGYMENEHQWIGDSSPPRDEAPVVEPPTRSEALWSPPTQQRSTFSWPSPRQERLQRQCQASEQIILPEPPGVVGSLGIILAIVG